MASGSSAGSSWFMVDWEGAGQCDRKPTQENDVSSGENQDLLGAIHKPKREQDCSSWLWMGGGAARGQNCAVTQKARAECPLR